MRGDPIEAFLAYLQFERNASLATVRTYRAALIQFANIVGKSLLDVEQDDVRRYMGVLRGQVQTATVRARLGAVRSFYRFLTRRGHIGGDPTCGIRLPKSEQRLPRFVELDTVLALLSAPDQTTYIGARDTAIMEVLFSSGLRAAELVALDVEDVDTVGGLLRVRCGKGRRARVVPIGESALAAIRRHFRLAPLYARPDKYAHDALFRNINGGRLTTRSVARILARYAELLGIPTVNPHAFRHGAATAMINRGCSIRHVQVFLGHADVGTTQIYTRTNYTRLQAAYAGAFPRA